MPINSQEDYDLLLEAVQSGQVGEQDLDFALGMLEEYKWTQENLDTTPARSSRLVAAQRQAQRQRASVEGIEPTYASTVAARRIPIPKSTADLPALEAGSRAAVLEREEARGLDTMSGLTTFGEKFNLARKVNGSNAQFQMLYALAKDNLEEAGHTLPQGVDPIRFNEDLGQLEAYVPTEDGKVKRVLVDPEFFRLEDFGGVADIEEMMAVTGAVLSQLTGGATKNTLQRIGAKHPALAEFLGDFGWRNTGVVLEGLLDAEALGGDTSLNDVEEALAFGSNFGESAFGTAIGRTMGRFLTGSGRGGDVDVEPGQFARRGESPQETAARAEAEVNRTIQESADTLEDLNRLTEQPFVVDRGMASDSDLAIQVQGAREARLTAKNASQLETVRDQNNRRALSDAVDNIHHNKTGGNPNYDPPSTVRAINEAVEARGRDLADISVERTTVDNMETTRYFFHEGPDVSIGKGAVDQIQPGLRLTVNHDEGAIYINTLADVEGFRGGSALLLERAIGDMAERLPPGYRVYSDTHMSESAVAMIESLSEQGFGVVKLSDGVKVRTDEAGIAHHISQDGYPLYEITDVPGYMVAIPIVDDVGKFGVENFSKTLDDTYALVGAAKASLDDANARLTANIGWNPDRQTSIYKFRNTPGSKLNRQIKQLQTRMDRVLTGADRTEAGRILNTVVKQEQDEFGETVFRGLTEDMLDLGNLMRARETLNSIADRTGDLEITSFVNTIDEILTSGKFLDTAGRPVGLDIANALDNMIVTTRAAQSRLSYAESRIVRNNIFAKSDDGQYLNVNLKELGTYLRSGSKFFKHLKPVLESNPSAVGDLQNAVGDLYRDQVLSGTGWTKGKHDTFLRNYDTALKELFDDEAINAFRSTNFDSKGKNLFLSRIEDSRAALNRLSEMGTLDPTDILGSLNKIGGTSRRGAWRYLKEVERLNPKLAAQIKNDAIEQTRRYLQNTFFDPVTATKGPIQMSKELESWLATNNNTLRALHGDQYVTDLGAVVRAHKLDARRARIGAQKPQDQSDTIRTSRTILGPLSRLQRRITAGNWIKIRLTAKRALDVYSDPAKLRQLRASKAVPARSRPGIAVLARIGLIPGTGWDGQGDLPQDVYDKGIEFLDWVQDVSEQQEADQEEFELQGNTPYGREVIRSAKRPAHPVHIDGTPYEQYLREAQASR